MKKILSKITKPQESKEPKSSGNMSNLETQERQLLAAAIETERKETDIKTIWDLSLNSNLPKLQILFDFYKYKIARNRQDNQKDIIVQQLVHILKPNKNRQGLTVKDADKIVRRIQKFGDKKDLQDELIENCAEEFITYLSTNQDDESFDDSIHPSMISKYNQQPALDLNFPSVPTNSVEQVLTNQRDECSTLIDATTLTI